MKQLVISLIFVLSAILAIGQKSAILEKYVAEGLSNNLSLKKQDIALEQALTSIALARSNYAPKITFAPTYTLAAGGRKLQFPIGDLLNPVYGTLNQLTQSNNFPQVENVNEQLAPNNFHETVMTFQYPIFNPNIKYNWLIQKELLQSERAKKKVLEHELKYQIETAYLQYLMSIEGLKSLSEAEAFLHNLVSFNQKLVDNKVALKDNVLSAKNELSKIRQQQIKAKSQSQVAQAYFNFLLNKQSDSPILIDESFMSSLPQKLPKSFFQEKAQTARPEFSQLQSGIKVSETAIQLAEKNAKLPEVFIGGSAGFQGFRYTFSNQAFAVGQIGMKWDIFHGKEKKYKVESANIQKNMVKQQLSEVRQQVELQVDQAYIEMEASESFLKEIEPSLNQNMELLRIIESKYKNGNALTIEILKAQNDLLISRLDQTLATYDLWFKYTQLLKVSGL